MPVQHDLWRIGAAPEPLSGALLDSEKQLEEMIVAAPAILSSDWMLIGRQERTSYGKIVDLLAVAPDGSLVLIELKRGKTPWDVVAQALDYASWVERLEARDIADIYRRFTDGSDLAEDFKKHSGADLDEEQLNQTHQIVILSEDLDDSTERITRYLSERGVPINVLFFRVFKNGNEKLLSRVWLVDPNETQADTVGAGRGRDSPEPWNGEYYVSFDGPWEDARKYGFISGGGGHWYSRTLKLLSPGDRVWVNVPGKGYVGVGRVTEKRQRVTEFEVDADEDRRPVLDVLSNAEKYRQSANDPEKVRYFVRIQWLDTKPESEAVRELGFFGNQNTVCQPRTPKWKHTVDHLKTNFPKWQSE